MATALINEAALHLNRFMAAMWPQATAWRGGLCRRFNQAFNLVGYINSNKFIVT